MNNSKKKSHNPRPSNNEGDIYSHPCLRALNKPYTFSSEFISKMSDRELSDKIRNYKNALSFMENVVVNHQINNAKREAYEMLCEIRHLQKENRSKKSDKLAEEIKEKEIQYSYFVHKNTNAEIYEDLFMTRNPMVVKGQKDLCLFEREQSRRDLAKSYNTDSF